MHDACFAIFSCKFEMFDFGCCFFFQLVLGRASCNREFLLYNRSVYTRRFFFYVRWINLQSAILMMLLTFIYNIENHSSHCEANQFFFVPSPQRIQSKDKILLGIDAQLLVTSFRGVNDDSSASAKLLWRSKVIFCVVFITDHYDFIAKINGRINYLQRFLWSHPA